MRSGQPRRTEAAKAAAEAAGIAALRAGATVSKREAAGAARVGLRRMKLAIEAGDVASLTIAGEVRVLSRPLLAALGLGPESAGETEGAPS